MPYYGLFIDNTMACLRSRRHYSGVFLVTTPVMSNWRVLRKLFQASGLSKQGVT